MTLKDTRVRIFIILIAVFLLGVFFLQSSSRDNLYTVIHGEVRDKFATEAIFIREEILYSSPAQGKVHLLAGEGERVRSGSIVLRIETDTGFKNVYSPLTGMVSFRMDGWEDVLTPDRIHYFDFRLFSRVQTDDKTLRDGQSVRVGHDLFRVVNNFILYIMISVPQGEEIPEVGRRLRVNFPRLDTDLYWGTVILHNKQERYIVLQVDRFVDEFLSLRKQPVQVIRGIYHGMVVPYEALDIEKGIIGIWMPGRDGPQFRVVELLGNDGDFAVVEGLRVGEEIYINPPD